MKRKRGNTHFYLATLILLANTFSAVFVSAQSSNHWTRNFNEVSSLLSGAVVGGGAGPAAIFYNPASISEVEASNLSLNASLFSVDFINAKNVWGDELDLKKTKFIIVPRFMSYMIKPKNNPNLSMEVAFLNYENSEVEDVNSVDKLIDILPHTDGLERYSAYYNYSKKYRDDWLGFGGSYKVRNHLFFGASMFASIQSLNYSYQVDIEAGPPSLFSNELDKPFFTARYTDLEYLKYNNYRLLWKLGLFYKRERLNVGVNITTPSIAVFADGKRVMRKRSQSNITHPETEEAIPNYFISDFAEGKNARANPKSPLSIAAGLNYSNFEKTKTLYVTVEYFSRIDSYRFMRAQGSNSENSFSGTVPDKKLYDEWLSFMEAYKPVTNLAIGYRWLPKKDLMVLAGFRTDFNHHNKHNYSNELVSKEVRSFHPDRYHLTGGLNLTVFGQDLMAGLQYTLGLEKNEKQFINLSDPVEYNPDTFQALQGERNNNRTTILNSVSLYFGATINFGSGKKE